MKAHKSGKLSSRQKREINRLLEQALHALSIGKHRICEQLCLKIEAEQPNNPDALNLRGICATRSNDPTAAMELFRQAASIAPNRSEFHINLGGLQLTSRQPDEALQSYQRALQIEPKSLAAQAGVGNALLAIGRCKEAVEMLERVQKRLPDDIDIHMQLYRAFHVLKHMGEAKEQLNRILAVAPNHPEAHCRMAQIALEQGRMEEAEKEVQTTLHADPGHIDAYSLLIQIKKFTSEDEPNVTTMKQAYEASAPHSVDRLILSYCLGMVLDKLKQYDRAFPYFRESNEIRKRQSTYDPALELSHLEEIMRTYTHAAFNSKSDLDDETPIFILGMPRCGSTLTEQILAAHPEVASQGEWGEFENRLLKLGQDSAPITLQQLVANTPEQWRELGQSYLEKLKEDLPTSARIVDKSLNSIRLAGSIHCALPKAKIIHVRRHPLDTCLSIYKNNVRGALFDFGRDLETLGHYYAMYLRLMQHWRDVLPAGVMYEMDYELLVANQEEESRKLLKYCGLPWDDRCLQFNKAKTIVRTASIAQVRKPIYKDSMAAWKRYEKHLQPLIEILGPAFSTEYQPGRF